MIISETLCRRTTRHNFTYLDLTVRITPRSERAISPLGRVAARPVVVTSIWSGYVRRCFYLWGPGLMYAIHAFGGKGQCAVRRLWLLTCHIIILRGARGKVWAGHSLWKVRFSRWWVWLHFFILRTRCVVLRLVAVGIHNDFTYLVQVQQTSPFSAQRLTTLHFVNKKNSHHLPQQLWGKTSPLCVTRIKIKWNRRQNTMVYIQDRVRLSNYMFRPAIVAIIRIQSLMLWVIQYADEISFI